MINKHNIYCLSIQANYQFKQHTKMGPKYTSRTFKSLMITIIMSNFICYMDYNSQVRIYYELSIKIYH